MTANTMRTLGLAFLLIGFSLVFFLRVARHHPDLKFMGLHKGLAIVCAAAGAGFLARGIVMLCQFHSSF